MSALRIVTGLLATGLFVAATPASAAQWLVAGMGIVTQTPTPPGQTALPGVSLAGQVAHFAMVVDDGRPGTPLAAPGGVGAVKLYQNVVSSLVLAIGDGTIVQRPGAPGSVYVYDNVTGAPGMLLDQFTYIAGVDYSAGFNPHLLTDLSLPEGSHVTSMAFGRTASGLPEAPPTMLTGTDFPDVASVWQPVPGFLFTFDVRQGTASNSAALRALPVARFNVSQLQFSVVELQAPGGVPEPATWALLIAGFGLVGAAARRRKPATN